jgi:hypothetical protein
VTDRKEENVSADPSCVATMQRTPRTLLVTLLDLKKYVKAPVHGVLEDVIQVFPHDDTFLQEPSPALDEAWDNLQQCSLDWHSYSKF